MLFRWVQQRLLKIQVIPVRTATKRASGGNKAVNNTAGRRLGPKKGEGQFVEAGQIIWRQRGTAWYPGENAGIGRDHTIFAKEPGYVRYYRDPFHAKRRFIAVALSPEYRLPTPHFEPRRRRFGYTPIDNEEVAEFERDYITKKQTEHALQQGVELEKREAKRLATESDFQQALQKLVPDFTEEQALEQAGRFSEIRQYMNGGLSSEEAREVVDGHARDDLALEVKVGRLSAEECAKEQEEVDKLNALADSNAMLVKMESKYVVVKYETSERQAELKQAAISEIEKLAIEHKVTPSDVIEKVEELLQNPIFSIRDRVRLRRKHLRRPLPVQLTKETRAEYEKLVSKKQGKIQDVFMAQDRTVRPFYIPNGAAMIFN